MTDQGMLFGPVAVDVPPATLPDLSRYDRFAVDTETNGIHYGAVPVGVSVATPDGYREYFCWGHQGGGNNVTLAQVVAWANVEFARPNQLKLFFNLPYDLRMLHAVGIYPKGRMEDASTVSALLKENERWYNLDYLSKQYVGEGKEDDYLEEWMTLNFGRGKWKENIWRAPGNVVAPYAMMDPVRTLQLYDVRRPLITTQHLDEIYKVETALLPLMVKMYEIGVRVDRTHAEEVEQQLKGELGKARERWDVLAPGVNPLSTDQVAEVFRANGLPVNATAEGNDSITKGLLKEIGDHELATMLQTIRQLTKYAGTFVQNYVLANTDEHNLIHGEFHPLAVEYKPGKKYGTVSGRFSSGGALNLQNLPGDQQPEMKKLIRGLFVPYLPDMDWLKADYSQIEYRVLAHYAGDPIKAAYLNDPFVDFHDMMVDLINSPLCPRPRAKNVNFAVVFGAGVPKAAAMAGIPEEEMEKIFEIYHEKTGNCIKNLNEQVKKRAKDRGYITTWGGRRRRFLSAEEARKLGWNVKPWETFMETHKALNSLIQGSAADILKKSMVRVAELVDWENVFLHLTVHDELDLSIPRGDAGTKFRKDLRVAMEDWQLAVPIKVELEQGASWGATNKLCNGTKRRGKNTCPGCLECSTL